MGPDTGQIADVLLPLKLDHPFSYRIRPEQSVNVGDIVRVSFGRRAEVGVVWRIHDAAPKARLKPIEARLDLPPMGEAQRRFVQWMADYYVSDPGSVLRLFIRSRELLRSLSEQRVWRLTDQRPQRLTPQRAKVLAVAAESPPLSIAELAELAGVSPSVVRGLIELGCFSEEHRPKAAPFATPDPDRPRAAPLSAAQEEAARRLRDKARQGGFCATLLDGVTGAGKTEVYFEAMAEALRHGRQVLLLVPEIALTATFVRRVAERFGAEPALWHSAQSGGSRIRVHRAVAAGEARIVVAARSGLFLPWRDLGLIVVDEEHESAYKQEGGVPYHGRDMAVVLASLGRFPVILSSATPSLESLTNVERGKYDHVTLRERHGAAGLPAVRLLDLRRAPPEPGGWLAPPLVEAVTRTLERGEQTLLFLNRRGYAPLTLCRACGHRLQCPNCSAWLVQHRRARRLLCHHCGHAGPIPAACPSCGAEEKLAAVGPGVERLAEEAARRWPEARLATLSSDLHQGAALKRLLEAIAEGAYDIIIGTQLIAKGHHFPNLTLAGVVDADLALETTDPRAAERTWQLLAQVAGRAGRVDKPGLALIQTHGPEHPLMAALAASDRDAFIAFERAARQAAGMPPFGRLAALIVSARDDEAAADAARRLALARPPADRVMVLGPVAAPIHRLRGRWRYRLLAQSPRAIDLSAFVRAWLSRAALPGSVRLEVDIDPYSFM